MDNLSAVESLFFTALEKGTAEERAAYLDQACGRDTELRRHVECLLSAQPKVGDFLQRPSPNPATAVEGVLVFEPPGTLLGPYKLLQQIGEGGMGVVYLAEQTEPVRRKVALKVIKPGLDSGQVLARFEAERQALALMDHPNIARVLDAGATPEGRPYFVMELVKGTPITEFSDQNRLTPRERLELFVPVCHAIQHAHQKGIIHRDIKPSNVLVALYDGQPVPKVIDFGIAKATDQRLTERTLFTRHGQIVGTFEYMSPEQATLDALDVDTRSDVYALGVLLYELLNGTTPLDRERLRQAAFGEILRLIREEEPPRPSTRLSGSGGGLPMIAAYRKTESQKLPKLVRGELDWIAMKALEKDRNRRYETANGLAMDVQRYLRDEPVVACPPSALYRFGKLVRRNRVALTTCTVVALVLLLGTAVSVWQAVEATEARRLADHRLEQEQQARANEERQRRAAVEHARKADEQRLLVESNMILALRTLDHVYSREYITTQDRWPTPPRWHRGASLEKELAVYEQLARKQREIYSDSLQFEMAKAEGWLASLYGRLNRLDDAAVAHRRRIATLEKLVQKAPAVREYRRELSYGYFWMGYDLRQQGWRAKAEGAWRKCLALARQLAAEAPKDAAALDGLQGALRVVASITESPREAAQLTEQRLEALTKGAELSDRDAFRSQLASAHNTRAWQLATAAVPELRDAVKALAHARKAVELGPMHEYHWDTLGVALYRNEEWKEAVGALEWSMTLGDTAIIERFFFLAMAHWQLGDKKQARTWYDRGAQAIRNATLNATQRLAQVEAATLLGITAPDPKGKKQVPPKG
jgi:serine/threonine protein kinase/tetratricopeptide (TPR) repeat protein